MSERLFPADWQQGPRYGGPYSFARVPASRDFHQADVAVIGVPMDMTVMYRSGARFGPRAIRNASGQLRPHALPGGTLEEPYASLRVIDYGDIEVYPGNVQSSFSRIQAVVEECVSNQAFPIILGGDHSLTLPVLRVFAKYVGTISLIHFDAHPDFWPPTEEQPFHHGTVFRNALDEYLIDPTASLQIGIRGSLSAGIVEEARRAGFHVVTAEEIARDGVAAVVEAMHRIAWRAAYVSLDIDCVDPAFAPATGTPEVAGLTSREILALLRGLKGINVVGFDLVEVAPAYDNVEITALLAANLVHEFLLILSQARKDRLRQE
ncbi:MAG TPA: agmatinase [Dehalococcoidia bacterium]|nr:agmatinase [Dehalococcoidia bacterium]